MPSPDYGAYSNALIKMHNKGTNVKQIKVRMTMTYFETWLFVNLLFTYLAS